MGSQTLLAVACIVTSLAAQVVSAQMSLDKLNQGIPRWFHSAIPLQLWQTCPNGDLTASAHEHIQTWRDLNPELEMHLHNDTAAEHFVKAWFSEKVYKTYMEFPLPVMRADFWRYAIVFVRGGFYADLDTRCLRPIHNWLELESPDDLPKQVELSNWRHCRMIIGLENPAHFCQWAFAAARGHPILGKVLENIMNKAFLGIDTAHKHFVHLHTGPGVFTESIMDMLGLPTNTRVLDAWKMVYTDNQVMQRANELGLCVFHEPFFRNRTLINSYASQSHEGTWSFPSWQKIQANIAEQEWAKRHPEEAAKQKSSGSS